MNKKKDIKSDELSLITPLLKGDWEGLLLFLAF